MNTGTINTQDGEILIAALFVMLTNWENAEPREGRRGRYLTTGALQLPRMRMLPDSLKNTLMATLNGIGMDIDDEALTETFSGMYEYQISCAVNRFESRAGEGISLTRREQSAIDKVVELLERKPDAVKQAFPPSRKAG